MGKVFQRLFVILLDKPMFCLGKYFFKLIRFGRFPEDNLTERKKASIKLVGLLLCFVLIFFILLLIQKR